MRARVALRMDQSSSNVDDFPADPERSCQGSMHLFPGTFRDVTASELAHLRTRFGDHQLEIIELPGEPG